MIIARVCNELGAGRKFSDEQIDPAVGVRLMVKVGDRVERDVVCMVLYHNRDDSDKSFSTSLLGSIELTDEIVERENIVIGVIDRYSS